MGVVRLRCRCRVLGRGRERRWREDTGYLKGGEGGKERDGLELMFTVFCRGERSGGDFLG